jgi:hypothetical protein
MDVNHFGIVFSIALILVVLVFTFLTTNGISVLPEISFTSNSDYSFVDYCKQLNLKC